MRARQQVPPTIEMRTLKDRSLRVSRYFRHYLFSWRLRVLYLASWLRFSLCIQFGCSSRLALGCFALNWLATLINLFIFGCLNYLLRALGFRLLLVGFASRVWHLLVTVFSFLCFLAYFRILSIWLVRWLHFVIWALLVPRSPCQLSGRYTFRDDNWWLLEFLRFFQELGLFLGFLTGFTSTAFKAPV